MIQQTRAALLAPLWVEQKEYTGAWCCAAFDTDRQIRATARRSWENVVREQETDQNAGDDRLPLTNHADDILSFSAGLILTRVDEQAQQQQADDTTLLKTQALLAVTYLLQKLQTPLPFESNSLRFFESPDLWNLVDPTTAGSSAPLRRAVYELLGAIVARKEDHSLLEQDSEETLQLVASRVLEHCWAEDEGWAGVIAFLRRESQV